MAKAMVSSDQIVSKINEEMRSTHELGGDCHECQVRRVRPVSDNEAKELGRNWNVDMTNGECFGDCKDVLGAVTRRVGQEVDAKW